MRGKNIERPADHIQYALAILGDKWTGLIIHELSVHGARFCDSEIALPGISPRTLSQRLSKLEIEGIVTKRLYCEHPPRYQYELTRKGNGLQHILIKMAEWGSQHYLRE